MADAVVRRFRLILGLAHLMLFALGLFNSALASAEGFTRTLSASEKVAFENWFNAQIFHSAALDAYWAKVEKLRSGRRAKRRQRSAFTDRDYVTDYPPTYEGPEISGSLLKRWRQFRDGPGGQPGTTRSEPLPGLSSYLASARRFFNFRPERIPEIEFKRRYAREALALGLTKDQVVRVYALETGGRGTADMQAGINPITGKGTPISSALGYAQLLAANSINVLAKHGHDFVVRLGDMVAKEKSAARRAHLEAKLNVLQRMVRTAKSVPYRWSKHVAFAKTAKGRALHVMNMDGDIGPWMQVVKLADLKRMAERKGRARLSGAEIELMNLAGPATGLEMMEVVGIDKPTSNFFSRRAYYRNTVVRGKSSSGLLEALDVRMQAGLKQDGAREFLAVFNELLGVRAVAPAAEKPVRSFEFAPRAFQPRN
jgi:hypothetical protein